MSKGKTKVKFVGGCLDGHFDDLFDTRMLSSEFIVRTGLWFQSNEDGGVSIMQGGDLNNSWHSFGIHKYKKKKKGNDGYYEYEFISNDVVNRCSAKIKKGTQCKHHAYGNLNFCATHK